MALQWILAVVLVCAVAGCGGGEAGGSQTQSNETGATQASPDIQMQPESPGLGVPRLTAVDAQVLKAGSVLKVKGTDLDRLSTVSVGGKLFSIESKTAQQVELRSPNSAVKGSLILGYVDESSVTHQVRAPYDVEVFMPVNIAAVTPAGGVQGATIALTGQGLASATHVSLSSVLAPVTVVNDHEIRFQVPPGAQTGALKLDTRFESVTALSSFIVVPSIQVAGMQAVVEGSGSKLTLTGKGLKQISQIKVGEVIVKIITVSDTNVVAFVPGFADGEIMIDGPFQQHVAVGHFSRVMHAPLLISSVTIAQPFAWSVEDPKARLLEGRSAFLKLDMTSMVPGVQAPQVMLTAIQSARELGAMPMRGPNVLPTASLGADVTGSFTARIPPEWVKPGVTYRIDVKPAYATQASISRVIQLAIDPAPALKLTMVPVQFAGSMAFPPDPAQARTHLIRSLPLVDSPGVQVRVRPVFDFVRRGDGTADHLELLDQVEAIRRLEAPGDVYFAWVSSPSLDAMHSPFGGLGYINTDEIFTRDPGSLRMSAFAVAHFRGYSDVNNPFDFDPESWGQLMIHEMGHVLGRQHAPCPAGSSAPADVDPRYPYREGDLGDVPMYDALSDRFSLPWYRGGPMKDAMGYCNGYFFSDYSFNAIRASLQRWSSITAHTRSGAVRGVPPREAALPGTAPTPLIRWSGVVHSGSPTPVKLSAPRLLTRSVPLAGGGQTLAQGPYRLCAVNTWDEQHCAAFTPVAVADSQAGAFAFAVHVPARGPWRQVRIEQDGQVLWSQDWAVQRSGVSQALPQDRSDQAVPVTLHPDTGLSVRGSTRPWRLRWPQAQWPRASVLKADAQGQVHVVALDLQGGEAVIHLPEDVPQTGVWWVDLHAENDVRRISLKP